MNHRQDLPYRVIAGVTPWKSRWVVVSAKVIGATVAPEPPRLFTSFADVLDERPSFEALVVNSPVGYPDVSAHWPRTCDREARALLGRRGIAVRYAPVREALNAIAASPDAHLDAVTAWLLPRYREVAVAMSPYRQRVVFEGNPELSFYQLNDDQPLRWSKRLETGQVERRLALERRLQGVGTILDVDLEGVPQRHLLDAAALMWSARRVLVHAAKRLPADPEWDSEGLRMELVY